MAFYLGPINDCEGRIRRDFTEFARLWTQVRDDWSDERCRRFEQENLSSLGPALSRFTGTLNEFCDSIRKADLELKDDNLPSDGLD